jgi:hypothetical protein
MLANLKRFAFELRQLRFQVSLFALPWQRKWPERGPIEVTV